MMELFLTLLAITLSSGDARASGYQNGSKPSSHVGGTHIPMANPPSEQSPGDLQDQVGEG